MNGGSDARRIGLPHEMSMLCERSRKGCSGSFHVVRIEPQQARIRTAIEELRRNRRRIEKFSTRADRQDRLAMSVLILHELQGLTIRHQCRGRLSAIRKDYGIPQHRWCRFDRHFDIDGSGITRYSPQAAGHEPRECTEAEKLRVQLLK